MESYNYHLLKTTTTKNKQINKQTNKEQTANKNKTKSNNNNNNSNCYCRYCYTFTCKELKMLNKYAMTTDCLLTKNSPSNHVVPRRHISTAHALAQYLATKAHTKKSLGIAIETVTCDIFEPCTCAVTWHNFYREHPYMYITCRTRAEGDLPDSLGLHLCVRWHYRSVGHGFKRHEKKHQVHLETSNR